MKYCSNCHRLSRDDDFCSHCGSAVYNDNSDFSAEINCDKIGGHSHEKQTFSGSNSQDTENLGKKMEIYKIIAIIIILIILFL